MTSLKTYARNNEIRAKVVKEGYEKGDETNHIDVNLRKGDVVIDLSDRALNDIRGIDKITVLLDKKKRVKLRDIDAPLHLNLEDNRLTMLPDDICSCVNIAYLHIKNNRVSTLPKAMTKMTGLRGLYVSRNPMKELPIVKEMPWLKKVELIGGALSEFPDVFACDDLISLNLASNSISIIPPEVGKLQRLKKLTLSDNKIKMLTHEIGNMSELTYDLKLDQNYLVALPDEICALPCDALLLSDNELKVLPENIGAMKNLKELYLDNNKLKALPQSVLRRKFTKLSYVGNPIAPQRTTKSENVDTALDDEQQQ